MDPGGAHRPYRGYPPLNLQPEPERRRRGPAGRLPSSTGSPAVSPVPVPPAGARSPPTSTRLVTAYGGTGTPPLHRRDPPNTMPYARCLHRTACDAGQLCGSITSTNRFPCRKLVHANCSVDITQRRQPLIVQGGTLVVEGASSTRNGCLVMNIYRTTCPPPQTSTRTAKTVRRHDGQHQPQRRTHDAIVYPAGPKLGGSALRPGPQGDLFMAKTFVYAADVSQGTERQQHEDDVLDRAGRRLRRSVDQPDRCSRVSAGSRPSSTATAVADQVDLSPRLPELAVLPARLLERVRRSQDKPNTFTGRAR